MTRGYSAARSAIVFLQLLTIVDSWTEHHLGMDLYAGIQQSLDLRCDIGALLVDAE